MTSSAGPTAPTSEDLPRLKVAKRIDYAFRRFS
jgi:hypothetical protein